MKEKIKLLFLWAAAAVCIVLTGCEEMSYSAEGEELPDGVSVTVTVTASETLSPEAEQTRPAGISEIAQALGGVSLEIQQWLDKDICENGFDRLSEFFRISASGGEPQYSYEEIMAGLEESVGKKEEYFDLMYENRNEAPELYEAWREIDREIENLQEQAKLLEQEAAFDTAKLHESCEKFYEVLAQAGVDGFVVTEAPTVSGTVTGSESTASQESGEVSQGSVTSVSEVTGTSEIMYAAKGAEIYLSPSEEGAKLSAIPEGSVVIISGEEGDWYIISANGMTAYVKKSAVTEENPFAQTTTTSLTITTSRPTVTTTPKPVTTTTSATTASASTSTKQSSAANTQKSSTTSTKQSTKQSTQQSTAKTTTASKSSQKQTTTAAPNDTGTEYHPYVNEVLKLVNEERAKEGLSPLILDDKLCKAADVRAKEISADFSHTRPDGSKSSTAIKEQGVSYKVCAENIARGQTSPKDVVAAWMASDSHRANIMGGTKDTKFTHIGISYYKAGGSHYWVLTFCAYTGS